MIPTRTAPAAHVRNASWERARPAALTQSLPEQIAAQLSTRIVSAHYAPGQRIMEQAIAAEFAVSRGPVREALRLLERDGLVTILPRRGALVLELSLKCAPAEAFQVAAQLRAWLKSRGVRLGRAQQTKTRAALDYFSARARTASS